MKNLILTISTGILAALASGSCFAEGARLSDLLPSSTCRATLKEDFVFDKGMSSATVGHLRIRISNSDNTVRRLKAGRVLIISAIEDGLKFKDRAAVQADVLDDGGYPIASSYFTPKEFEDSSGNSVAIQCVPAHVSDL